MSAPVPLRMTERLFELIAETAKHVGRTPSEIVRATCVGIIRGRNVIPREISNEYYASGGRIMTFKGITFPEIERDELRRIIALRCFEELKKEPYNQPVFQAKEGKDYIIEEVNA